MQSLAWGTILILVLLLPGFCFFPGLYAPERFSRDLTPRNPLGSLASIVLVALLTHAALTLLFSALGTPVLWERVLEALVLSPATGAAQGGITPKILAGYYAEDAVRIPGYIVLSCLAGWTVGLFAGHRAVRGAFPFLAQHPWANALHRDDAAYAYVLSDVEHDQKVLLYQGRLLHFGLNADGSFSYVMLSGTNQGFLDLSGPAPKAGEFARIGRRQGLAEGPRPGAAPRNGWAGSLGRLGLGRVDLDLEAGALLSIAASNMRDVVLQTYRQPLGDAPDADLARYQSALKELGFYDGQIDGTRNHAISRRRSGSSRSCGSRRTIPSGRQRKPHWTTSREIPRRLRRSPSLADLLLTRIPALFRRTATGTYYGNPGRSSLPFMAPPTMSTLETAAAPPRPRSPRTFWWLVAVQALGVVSLLPWLFAFGYGPTHFDLLYGDADAGMWAAALLVWAYPLVLVACSVCAWVAYRRGRNTLAVALSAVPLFFSAYHVKRVYHYNSQPTDCCALLGPVPIMQPPGTTPGSS